MRSQLHTRIDSSQPPDGATIRLNPGQARAVDASTEAPLPLTFAGHYELLDLLGRGGMGVVYLARQRGSTRQVAYKVLTALGGSDPDAIVRFRAEADTLARLHHPGIVQVLDSGTDLGTPFIAMEFVPGGSLGDKLRVGRLNPPDAARLIAAVAAAVGHAHALGVIHRDLKPSNILLDTEGQPKVADFGLARDVAGAPRTYCTRTGIVAGTPMYMPPEQLEGKRELTPAVDVWALGVILYEMLTGTVPFSGSDPPQILTNVLWHEPVPPRVWQPHLPRELETICLKCLQKEPRRRYASATELAEDVSRFLGKRPIHARPVGAVERGIRWCRRNPVVAGLTAVILVMLGGASAVSLAFGVWANRERASAVAAAEDEAGMRRHAEAAAEAEQKAHQEAEAMSAMLDSLLASIQPGQDALASLRKEMDSTADALQRDTGDPLVRARLLYTLALARRKFGDCQEAAPLLEQSLAIRTEQLGADHPLTRQTACEMSYNYISLGRAEDALRVLKPIVDAESAAQSPDSPELLDLLHLLRIAYHAAGQLDTAEALGERMLAICAKRYGDDNEETEWMRINLRRYSVQARRFEEAIPVLKKAYARFQATWGPDSVQFICARAELGRCLLENGQPNDALPYLKEMYECSVARNGPSHPHAIIDRQDLARCYEACGLFDDAVAHRRGLRDYFCNVGDIKQADFQADQLARDLAAIKQ